MTDDKEQKDSKKKSGLASVKRAFSMGLGLSAGKDTYDMIKGKKRRADQADKDGSDSDIFDSFF